MKMKSKFSSFNVKLALMLVAICGMFASCYQKEEIDVPTPSTTPAEYNVKGVVTNAQTGMPLTAFTVNGQSFTPTDGQYTLKLEKAGVQTVTIGAEGYTAVSKSIDVKELSNGQVGTYIVDAALIKNIPDPEYMKNQYDITGTLFDMEGKKVKFATGDKITIEGLESGKTVLFNAGESTFKVDDVKPGNYTAFVQIKGYNSAYAQIVITESPLTIGKKDEIKHITTQVNVVLQAKPSAPKYYIEGNIWGANNVIVDGATVEITLNNGATPITPSVSNGYFNVEIPAEFVAPTVLATLKVSKSTYYPYACSFLMIPVADGQTSVSTVNVTLIPISSSTTEDGSIGGNTSLNPEGNVTTETAEEIKDTPATVTDDSGEKVDVKVDDLLNSMQEATGETITTEEVITIATTAPLNKELASDIVLEDGTVNQVKDVVELPAQAIIIYTQATETGSTTPIAQNINVSRDLATEKAEAAVRTYEGTPKGVVFATPLSITFGEEIGSTEKADYLLPVLYYNETDKVWVEDKVKDIVNYAIPQEEGQFKAHISHFSKFKFGFVSNINKDKPETTLPSDFKAYQCFTGNYDQVITVKGQYKGGSRYVGNTPQLEANAKLAGMKENSINHIVELMEKMIKSDNMNLLPQPNYRDVSYSQDMKIGANQQIEGFNITRNEKEIEYSIKVIKADKTPVTLTVTVATIASYKVEPKYQPGHGHGTDLNAGGGIVNLD